MIDYVIRTPDQLSKMLSSFRKSSGLTQSELALRMGVTQQTISASERNADAVSAARLMRLLNILDVELVLRKKRKPGAPAASTDTPEW
jgi:HTH-type transcriptional regulator/antitoxin HipB